MTSSVWLLSEVASDGDSLSRSLPEVVNSLRKRSKKFPSYLQNEVPIFIGLGGFGCGVTSSSHSRSVAHGLLGNMLRIMDDVFTALGAIMVPHTKRRGTKFDEPGNFYVDTVHVMKNGKPLFFGAAQTKKNYVSFHLIPA